MKIHIKPTMSCNLACYYCNEKRDTKKMSISTAADIIERAGEAARILKTPRVEFEWSGGEPLMLGNDFYSQVFHLQLERIPAIVSNTFYTNLLLLDVHMADLLQSVGADIYTSLDDLDDNQLRIGNPSSYFNLFDQQLSLIINRGLRVKLYMTVTRYNVSMLSQVYEYAKSRAIDFDFSNVQKPYMDGESKIEKLSPPIDEFIKNTINLFDQWYTTPSEATVVKPFYAVLKFLVTGARTRPTALPTFDSAGFLYTCPFDISKDHSCCTLDEMSGASLSHLVRQPCNEFFGVYSFCKGCLFTDFCNWMLCKDQAKQMRISPDRILQYTCAYWKPVFEHIYKRVLLDLERSHEKPDQSS